MEKEVKRVRQILGLTQGQSKKDARGQYLRELLKLRSFLAKMYKKDEVFLYTTKMKARYPTYDGERVEVAGCILTLGDVYETTLFEKIEKVDTEILRVGKEWSAAQGDRRYVVFFYWGVVEKGEGGLKKFLTEKPYGKKGVLSNLYMYGKPVAPHILAEALQELKPMQKYMSKQYKGLESKKEKGRKEMEGKEKEVDFSACEVHVDIENGVEGSFLIYLIQKGAVELNLYMSTTYNVPAYLGVLESMYPKKIKVHKIKKVIASKNLVDFALYKAILLSSAENKVLVSTDSDFVLLEPYLKYICVDKQMSIQYLRRLGRSVEKVVPIEGIDSKPIKEEQLHEALAKYIVRTHSYAELKMLTTQGKLTEILQTITKKIWKVDYTSILYAGVRAALVKGITIEEGGIRLEYKGEV